MDLLAWPGVVPMYVTSVTNSPAVGWAAFAAGMIFTYGGVGLAMDFAAKVFGRGTGRRATWPPA